MKKATAIAQTGATQSAPARIPAITTPMALMDRCRTIYSAVRVAGGNVAEPAFALSEFENGGFQLFRSELRPEDRTEIEFRKRGLPEQEIAHAALARGADDQVGIGRAGGVEVSVDQRLVDLIRSDAVGDIAWIA